MSLDSIDRGLIKITAEFIPAVMKCNRRWVGWILVEGADGRRIKKPFNIRTGQVDGQEACRVDWHEVDRAYKAGDISGYGYSLGERGANDDVVFIDLDNAVEVTSDESGNPGFQIKPWACDILDRFEGAYIEFSPSGTGIHIIVLGTVPHSISRVKNHEGVEIYDSGRYLAMTGYMPEQLRELTSPHLLDKQESLTWLYERTEAAIREAKRTTPAPTIAYTGDYGDDFEYATKILMDGWLDNRVEDYGVWLEVGFALHERFGAAGIDLWDTWSQRGMNYEAGCCHNKARTFGAGSSRGKAKFGSFVTWVRQAGGPPQRPPAAPKARMLPASGATIYNGARAGAEQSADTGAGATEEMNADDDEQTDETLSHLLGELEDTYTDLKFAETVKYIHGHKIRFNETWDNLPWVVYDKQGGLWRRTKVRHKSYFLDIAGFPGLGSLGNHGKVSAAASIYATLPNVIALASDFERQPNILNCINGVLDLETRQLAPHSPEFMTMKQAPVSFDPEAPCPTWLDNLERYLPDKEVRAFVQRFLGSALLGRPVTEALLCYGGGANGKSTVMNTVARILGEYSAKLPPGFITEAKGEKHPTEMTMLYGARFAIASETKLTDKMDEARVKSALGDGAITARGMNEDFWTFEPTHNLAVCVNALPSMSGRDDGIWRRLRFVEWRYQVPVGDRVEEFDRTLYECEAAGILNWLLDGLADYLASGMRPPLAVTAGSEAIRQSNDWAAAIVPAYTRYELDGETRLDERIHRIKLSDIYEQYVSQCRISGEKPLTSRIAGQPIRDAFERAGYEWREIMHVWWLMAARLKTDADYENELDRTIG